MTNKSEAAAGNEQMQTPHVSEEVPIAITKEIAPIAQPIETLPSSGGEYFTFALKRDFDVVVSIDAVAYSGVIGVIAVFVLWRYIATKYGMGAWRKFEIDSAEFGVGNQKITLRPNDTDRQIAYQIWVELSTRKIGLAIDVENDVIDQVYNSWYNFFSVTRELIKDVPVSKFRRKDTEKIITLSIEVLNTGIRPHLTKWQARYRRWYDKALENKDYADFTPQEIQKEYPEFETLMEDLMAVNHKLMQYRQKMYQLVTRK